MSRRRLFLIVALATLIALAVCLFVFAPRTEKSIRAAFDKIVLGMTQAEVRSLLGGPPQLTSVEKGLVRNSETFITNSDPAAQARDGHRDYTFCEWTVSHWQSASYVAVVFDGDSVVCRYLTVAPPGFWDNLRRYLSRLLGR